MFYYVDIQSDKIVCKNDMLIPVELTENQKEITEQQYEELQVPATFEADEEGNIVSFTQIVSDPPVAEEPIDEEKAALAEAVILLSDELETMNARLNTLEEGGEV